MSTQAAVRVPSLRLMSDGLLRNGPKNPPFDTESTSPSVIGPADGWTSDRSVVVSLVGTITLTSFSVM